VPQAMLIIQTVDPHFRGDDKKKSVFARSATTKQSVTGITSKKGTTKQKYRHSCEGRNQLRHSQC